MRTALWEDALSLVPPVVYLIGIHVEKKPATADYPFGRLNVSTVAFLSAATALTLMGSWLLLGAARDLVQAHRPSVGAVSVAGHVMWAGWPMLGAVAVSTAPMFLLGRLKKTSARKLHDKTLFADADMNKADWMTGLATGAGVMGIGAGWWWADAAAAALVSLDILRDGLVNLSRAVRDLLDRRPTGLDGRPLGVEGRVEAYLAGLPWVERVHVRCRQEGRFILVEACVQPAPVDGLVEALARATRDIRRLDWRIEHVVLSPVPDLPRTRARAPDALLTRPLDPMSLKPIPLPKQGGVQP
jgi:divalent metal cation (Fe/Co/Zn/Cd) transporter